MADSTEFRDGILSAWQGEQWGKAFFDRLAAATDDPGRRARWQVLAELEAATGDRLAPLVPPGAGSGVAGELPRVDAAASAYAELPYPDALRQMMTIVDPAIDRFRKLLALAPDAHRETAEILLDHEIAIKQFAERELAGDAETALDPVRAVIERARAPVRA